MDVKRIKRNFVNNSVHRFYILDKIGQFLKSQSAKTHARRNRQFDRPVSIKEIELTINILQKPQSTRPRLVHWWILSTFKEEIIPVLYYVFQKTEVKGIHHNSFYEANITTISKPDNDITRKENNRPICFMNIDAKVLNNIY